MTFDVNLAFKLSASLNLHSADQAVETVEMTSASNMPKLRAILIAAFSLCQYKKIINQAVEASCFGV
jgi:hypothetical protein